MFQLYCVIINNFIQAQCSRELTSYEEGCYHQLLMVTRAKARLDELLLQQSIKDVQDGKRDDQTPGGTAQQNPESEEHRSDDPQAPV